MILTCLPIEARVLADMLSDPDLLALCDEVESADFVDMRHVMVLHGIREAQLVGEVNPDTVVEAIQRIAMDHGNPALAEKINMAFLLELISKAPRGGRATIRRDITKLRSDREFREKLYEANAQALKESRR